MQEILMKATSRPKWAIRNQNSHQRIFLYLNISKGSNSFMVFWNIYDEASLQEYLKAVAINYLC